MTEIKNNTISKSKSTTLRRSQHNTTSRVAGPVQDTSLEARESLDEDTLSRWQREIYDYIEQANGATCWEVEQELELLHQSASPLIRQLRLKGQLVDTGAWRLTGSGRRAIVWGVAK